jgi:AcrR family transcriptional regulator
MLEIATRARVSKRELYALFDHKHAMLAACITERARQIRLPLELAEPLDRQALAATLTAFATAILRGVCEPNVLVIYRLAIADSQRSAQVARVLDSAGREATHAALLETLTKAQKRGLFGVGEPAIMTRRFFALLWEDLLVRLLLRVTTPPTLKEIERRAREATEALLALYPHPNGR